MLSAWLFFPLLWWWWWGFWRSISSTIHLCGELQIRVFACLWRFCRKMCCPTNSFLLSSILNHISLAPLCLAAAAAALRAQQQVFLLSGTPPGPLEGQRSVLSNTASLPTLCQHHPWSCLGRSLRVWFGKCFLHEFFIFSNCFQLSFNMGLSSTNPQDHIGGLEW